MVGRMHGEVKLKIPATRAARSEMSPLITAQDLAVDSNRSSEVHHRLVLNFIHYWANSFRKAALPEGLVVGLMVRSQVLCPVLFHPELDLTFEDHPTNIRVSWVTGCSHLPIPYYLGRCGLFIGSIYQIERQRTSQTAPDSLERSEVRFRQVRGICHPSPPPIWGVSRRNRLQH